MKMNLFDKLVIVVLVCLCSVNAADYFLGGIFPNHQSMNCTGPSTACRKSLFLLGSELESAFRIACDAVNRDGLEGGDTLQCDSQAVTGESTSAVTAATNLKNKNVIGVIGDLLSPSTQAVATLLSQGTTKYPQISYGSTAVSLSSITSGYFFRTVPSDAQQAKALIAIVKNYGWKQIAVIASSDTLASSLASLIEAEASSKTVQLLSSQRFTTGNSTSASAALKAIKASGSQVVIFAAYDTDVNLIMKQAKTEEMTGKNGVYWFGTDGVATATVTDIDALDSMQGILATRPKTGYGKVWDRLKADWESQDPSVYPGSIHNRVNNGPTPDPTILVGQTFDAVFAFREAINAILRANGDPNDKVTMRNALKAVNFIGTTGNISFISNGVDLRAPVYDLANFRGSKWEYAATWDSVKGLILDGVVLWPGGTTVAPKPKLVVKIGGLFPTNSKLIIVNNRPGLLDLGMELQAGYRVACEQANNMMEKIKLVCLTAGTSLSDSDASDATKYLISQNVTGVVGDLYSSNSHTAANILGPAKIPQISYGATANDFSNMALYPYFTRVVPADNVQAETLADLIKSFGWVQVATLASNGEYANFVANFEKATIPRNIQVLLSLRFNPNLTSPDQLAEQFSALKLSGISVILINAEAPDVAIAMQAAVKYGVHGTGYAYVGTDVSTTTDAFAALRWANNSALLSPLQGMIGLQQKAGFGTLYQTLRVLWKSKKSNRLSRKNTRWRIWTNT